jgi:hypothetical protein
MWTEEQRRIYRREGDGYPSDLRDAEWVRLEPPFDLSEQSGVGRTLAAGKGRATLEGDSEAGHSGRIGSLADKRTPPWLVGSSRSYKA